MRTKVITESTLVQKVKRLTQLLLISGILNIGLLTAVFTAAFKDTQTMLSLELKPLIFKDKGEQSLPQTKEEILLAYAAVPFSDLLKLLEEKEPIEEGFCRRDLSLSSLVSLHDFALEKALGGSFYQERKIRLGELSLSLFPGMTEAQFGAILRYVKTERWPYTSRGLFKQIQERVDPIDPTLLEAMYLTPEFEALALLCARTGLHVSKERLLKLICSGSWEMLATFAEQQRQALDLSPLRRDSLFLRYLQKGSPVAATLLLEADMPFALRRLDDSQVLQVLELTSEKPPLAEEFAKKLLLSPRTDTVWKKAAAKLYGFLSESVPEPYDHRLVVARFFPELMAKLVANTSLPKTLDIPKKIPEAKIALVPLKLTPKKVKTHLVQPGDSLWKIARKYQVTVAALMKCNQLESDKLRLGKELQIPENQISCSK